MTDFRHFERYRDLVDDWGAFCAASVRPLPTCVWTNTLRTTPGALAGRLTAAGLEPHPLAWYDGAFTLPPGAGAGTRLEFLAGLYHVQEEVSLLPVALLAPRPGERILDLCAAPGNKTAQIAVALQDRGTVVANDRSTPRSRAISGILDRLGVTCAVTTTWDAAGYPRASGRFDRVLADVPCSCEGTTRKHPDLLASPLPDVRRRLTGLQEAILRRAVQRCRPGGRVVYATCTYAPEENEMVVDAVLRAFGDEQLSLLPARPPGFDGAEGVTEWEGRRLHPSLRLALRAWPHRNDTGGFFTAVLHKHGGDNEQDEAPPAALPSEEDGLLRRAVVHFGLPPGTFDAYVLTPGSRRQLALVPRSLAPPAAPAPETVGLPFVRVDGRTPKLTTAAALAFGRAATRHVIDVSRAHAEAYLSRRPFDVTPVQAAACAGTGFVVVRHEGIALGVALFRADPSGGTVDSHFPRAWSQENVG